MELDNIRDQLRTTQFQLQYKEDEIKRLSAWKTIQQQENLIGGNLNGSGELRAPRSSLMNMVEQMNAKLTEMEKQVLSRWLLSSCSRRMLAASDEGPRTP
jgi:hypothetical protein